jgi:hypothetical protein
MIERNRSGGKYVEIFTHRVGCIGAPSRRTVFVRGMDAKRWEVPNMASRPTINNRSRMSNLGLEEQVSIPNRDRDFLLPSYSEQIWGPLSFLSSGYQGALSPRVKRPGREADYTPPSNAVVNNSWSYTSSPTCVFIAWWLIKHSDNFYFCTSSTCMETLRIFGASDGIAS